MNPREEVVAIPVGMRRVQGTIYAPENPVGTALFVHGWNGSQAEDIDRARTIASFGYLCLTFDLYGHNATSKFQSATTREDNMLDVMAAYEVLEKLNKPDAPGVIGVSYGGYLAALLTARKPVAWLALRAPALYRDSGWQMPKASFDRADLDAYRRLSIKAKENRALEACSRFAGDVLLVESEFDAIVPSTVAANYRTAFAQAASLTFRRIESADHALSKPAWQDEYSKLLISWFKEMIGKERRL